MRLCRSGVFVGTKSEAIRLNNQLIYAAICTLCLLLVSAAGFGLALYTEDLRLGIYMSILMLGCGITLWRVYRVNEVHKALAEFESITPVKTISFPYKAVISGAQDDPTMQQLLKAIGPDDYLTLRRDPGGLIRVGSEDGLLGHLSEKDSQALKDMMIETLCGKLASTWKLASGGCRVKIVIDAKDDDWFWRWRNEVNARRSRRKGGRNKRGRRTPHAGAR